ncbi:hypothetical protein IM40_00360 [Candidatus Paracaedimonas acanthamoebae]|nr:hypothetical protein IM40_00360 [Candidatus Paracaedimonas acanthamoebae]
MVKVLLILFYFELKGYESDQNVWNPLAFLLTCFSLLVVSLDPSFLMTSSGLSLFWIIFLFIVNLNFARFLRDDYEDGTIDLLRLSPFAFEWMLITKFLGRWMRLIGPFLMFLIIIGFIFGIVPEKYAPVLVCFLVSSLFLCATTAFISIISLGGKASSYLGPLLSLPLNIPLLIINSVEISFTSKLSYLGGFLTLIFPLFLLAKHCMFRIKIPQDDEPHQAIR